MIRLTCHPDLYYNKHRSATPSYANIVTLQRQIESEWINFSGDRVLNLSWLVMQDFEGSKVYECFAMVPTLRYLRDGERILSNGVFEVSIDEVAEHLNDFATLNYPYTTPNVLSTTNFNPWSLN